MKSHLSRILQEKSVMEGTSYSGSKRKVVHEVDDSDSSDSSTTSNFTPKRCKIVSSFFLFFIFFLVNFYDFSAAAELEFRKKSEWYTDISVLGFWHELFF